MKKITNLFSLSLLILISVLAPDKAHSLDITVGATAWYLWGNRNEDIISDEDPILGGNYSYRYGHNTNYYFSPSFLYGPAISIKFNNDFNLTFVDCNQSWR